MVVKMMKWRPWPPLSSKKFEAKITINRLRIIQTSSQFDDSSGFSVELKWKGSKGNALTSLRRKSVRRNFTKEERLMEDGIIEWDEEFQCICNLLLNKKGGGFHPWEVSFTVLNVLKHGSNNKSPVIATASLNLSDFACEGANQDNEINIPMEIPGGSISSSTSLYLSIILLELRNAEEPSEPIPRSIFSFPRSPCYGEVSSTQKDETPNPKSGTKKAKILKVLSDQRSKRTGHEEEVTSDGKSSSRSDEIEFNSSESLDDSDETDPEDTKESSSHVRKSFSYGTLAYANYAGAAIHANTSCSEDEDWIYYSHRKSDVGQLYPVDANSRVQDKASQQNEKRRLLPWKKRKLTFRSNKVKGEPLLKRGYGEEGGDDIDFDRRQLSSSDESTFKKPKSEEANNPSLSVFGDDNFAVGIWENKDIISRDGQMKLQTQVFFASIDQMSERAGGESACTALVAVISDFFQFNCEEMPIKSQLDSLIREGSMEWRNLCENETYRERFPDKHFDLETVLEAKIRPICVIPEKSFIGFFQPQGFEDKGFDFLQGAMSFDNIWDEIEKAPPNDPLIYIISWNDHFFVLKVERDVYYIIDTLGERLFEGCNQAFILKFDRDTIINQIKDDTQKSGDKLEKNETEIVANVVNSEEEKEEEEEEEEAAAAAEEEEEEARVVCTGKESCKEYIKSFLAAIPIRELEVDLKKGLITSTPLHHRLQIEFHYTSCLDPIMESCAKEEIDDKPATLQLTASEHDEP